MSDSPFTHKNRNFDPKHIGQKLDQLASKVIARGIHVVEKNEHGTFNIIEYTKKTAIVVGLPGYAVASNICEILNNKMRSRYVDFVQIQRTADTYNKLDNDCFFYKHTLAKSQDAMKRAVVYTRLDLTIQRMRSIRQELASIW
jgi:hypothetical protein